MNKNRRPLKSLLTALAIGSWTAGLVLLVVTLQPGLSSDNGPPPEWFSDESTLTGFTLEGEPPVAPTATDGGADGLDAETGDAEPAQAPLARIVAPSAGIDAPLITLGVDPQGVMEAPNRPDVVAWYDFSARPGSGSNAVFSGHLDFADYGAAVFWRLKELREGDEVQVTLADGTVYSYRVVLSTSYNAATAPVQEIVGPTDEEMITLITCGGRWDRESRQYDERLIVRAVRS